MKKSILAILLLGLLIVLMAGILEMPALGSIDNPSYTHVTEYYIENAIRDTNSPNMISAILTDYRVFDTLGETVVLFIAITTVLSVLNSGKGKPDKKIKRKVMDDLIVKSMSRMIIPFIQLYGIFVIMNGHLSPGGGFAGGAILGSNLILLTLAIGVQDAEKKMPHHISKVLESGAILLIIALGLVGIINGQNFMTNAGAGFDLGQTGRIISAGFIPIITIAIGIKVASTLITLFHTIMEGD